MLAIAGDAVVGVPAIGRRGGTCCITQRSKVGRSGAMPTDAGNDRCRRRHTIDNGQPGVDGGAVLGIDDTVNRRREYDPALFLQPDEDAVQAGLSGATFAPVMVTSRPPSGRRARADPTCRNAASRHLAIDMNRGRERWVHQHDTRHDAGIEVVVDVRGVKPGRGDGGKELREEAGTALGKFVENERGAGEFSKDGKKAGAGRRFEDDVGRRDRGRHAGDKRQPDGSRELLEGFTFLGPPCLCRKEARNPQQHRQHGGRRRRFGAHGGAIPSQEQDGRRLAGFIGRLPVPGAGRIGGGKRCLHGIAQNSGVDAPTPFKIGQKAGAQP